MNIIDYKDVDFVNYKLPSMYIIMPHCTFKCDVECGRPLCQNQRLASEPIKTISAQQLIDLYDNNPMSEAIVFGGLEPFDSPEDLQNFLMLFRHNHYDPIIIYTGYTEEEIKERFNWIFLYENIIIKFGRFVPDQKEHFDSILGVNLASSNQYAKEFNK